MTTALMNTLLIELLFSWCAQKLKVDFTGKFEGDDSLVVLHSKTNHQIISKMMAYAGMVGFETTLESKGNLTNSVP